MDETPEGSEVFAFNGEEFIYRLPPTRPEGSEYERRDGRIRLLFSSDPTFGVPFGHDRLLTLWLTAAYEGCGKPESGLIHVDSLDDIPRAFGLPSRRSKHAALERGLLRIARTTLFVSVMSAGTGETASGERLGMRRYNLLEGVDLARQDANWPTHGPPGGLVILFSEFFVRTRRERVLPIDLKTAGALRNDPGALDLYLWQAHRNWELHRRRDRWLVVPILGPKGLLMHLDTEVDGEEEALCQLRTDQELVQEVWPGCPNRLTEDGRSLVLRPCEALGKTRTPLPGVSTSPRIRHLTLVSPSLPSPQDGNEAPVPSGPPEEDWT